MHMILTVDTEFLSRQLQPPWCTPSLWPGCRAAWTESEVWAGSERLERCWCDCWCRLWCTPTGTTCRTLLCSSIRTPPASKQMFCSIRLGLTKHLVQKKKYRRICFKNVRYNVMNWHKRFVQPHKLHKNNHPELSITVLQCFGVLSSGNSNLHLLCTIGFRMIKYGVFENTLINKVRAMILRYSSYYNEIIIKQNS